jgi:polyisoprenoid-binding protein YceI
MSVAESTSSIVPAGTWAVDPVHTTIGFQVIDTADLFGAINGRFTEITGRVVGGDSPSFSGTIRVESLRTENERRDAHLISPDFLDAAAYPEIRFESTAVDPVADDRFQVRGNLVIKNQPFEIELETRVRGTGLGQAGDQRLVLDGRGSFVWGTTTVELTAAVAATKET